MMLIKIILCLFAFISVPTLSADFNFKYGAALHGELKYKDGFSSFDYVNVSAPNGGELVQASFGSFDTFNPFTINGIAPSGIGLTYDSLMKQSADEPFSLYGLIADGIDILPNNKGVAFHINPKATFNDGTKITAKDVLFSFNILKEKGVPTYRYYYRDVENVEIIDAQTIVFNFKKNIENKELPFILGELPVLSSKYWKNKDFSKTSMEVPVSSGPYIIDSFQPGRGITYKKNQNYWGWDLNVNKGFYHFNTFKFDYYRDTTVAIEAFKAGEFDVRVENEAKKWVHFKQEKNVLNGKIKMRSFKHKLPSGMQGFVFNLRKPLFQEKNVRKALALVFDFDWMNQNLFHGLYKRTNSFFDNSELKAPINPTMEELEVLNKYKNELPKEVFEPLILKNKEPMRKRFEIALDLLAQAGWHVNSKGKLMKGGQPFEFEILLDSASSGAWERIVLPYIGQLRRIGINATIRTVDLLQYKNRLDSFEYDMIVTVWGQSLSPGNEQRYFWGSSAADNKGSMNYSGIKNKVVDYLIENIVSANTREELVTAVHALDRVLLNEIIVIPHWHTPENRYLYKNTIGIPEKIPLKGTSILTWWQI